MKKVLWSDRHRSEFEESLRLFGPFKRSLNNRQKALSKREKDPSQFIDRIKPQILEIYERNLPYLTPEDWDSSYHVLNNKVNARRSYSILKRMTWSQFIIQFEEVIKTIK